MWTSCRLWRRNVSERRRGEALNVEEVEDAGTGADRLEAAS